MVTHSWKLQGRHTTRLGEKRLKLINTSRCFSGIPAQTRRHIKLSTNTNQDINRVENAEFMAHQQSPVCPISKDNYIRESISTWWIKDLQPRAETYYFSVFTVNPDPNDGSWLWNSKWVTDRLTTHNESGSGSLLTYLYIGQLCILRMVYCRPLSVVPSKVHDVTWVSVGIWSQEV